jgi:hypothetical protein
MPPGQSATRGFPVLSAGPTPHIRREDWSFSVKIGPKLAKSWSWEEFNTLPQTEVMCERALGCRFVCGDDQDGKIRRLNRKRPDDW